MEIKQAYIELKNRENFEIVSIGVSDVLYHGTSNILIGNIEAPLFLSQDPLQSLGHSIIYTEYLKTNIERLYELCMKHLEGFFTLKVNIPEDKQINIDFLTKFIKNNIPLLYEFKVSTPIKLLSIKKSYDWNNSFSILININILPKYIIEKYEIVFNKFMEFIKGLIKSDKDKIKYQFFINENYKISVMKNALDINKQKHKIILKILKYVNYKCKFNCFAGFYDTIIYLILQNINYNDYYLKEIKLISDDDFIDGFKNEPDQDAIILLNTTIIKIDKIHIIYPHKIINYDDTEISNIISYILLAKKEIYDKINYYKIEEINKNNKTYNMFLNDIFSSLEILNIYYKALFYTNDNQKWFFSHSKSIEKFNPNIEEPKRKTLESQVVKCFRITVSNIKLLQNKLQEYIKFILSKNVKQQELESFSTYKVSKIRES